MSGEGGISVIMDPAEVTPAIRSSKRCLSPSAEINIGNAAKKKRRKVADPLLILVQEEVLRKREVGFPGCLEEVGKQYEAVLMETRKSETKTMETSNHKIMETSNHKTMETSNHKTMETSQYKTMETSQYQGSNNQKQKDLKQAFDSISLESLNKQLNKIFAK